MAIQRMKDPRKILTDVTRKRSYAASVEFFGDRWAEAILHRGAGDISAPSSTWRRPPHFSRLRPLSVS